MNNPKHKIIRFFRQKNPLNIYIISLILISILNGNCKNPKTNDKNKTNNDFWEQRFSIIRESDSLNYFNQELIGLSKIFDDSLNVEGSNIIVFYFSGFDCTECIAKGFKLISKFQNNPFQVIVISSEGSISDARKQYGFVGSMYEDNFYLLNKQLSRTCTPVFIKLNFNIILDMYHLDNNYDKDEIDLENFLKLN